VIRWLVGGIVAALVLAGCGSSSSSSKPKSSAPTTTATDPSPTAQPAGATPSESAAMICAEEAQRDLEASLGAKPVQVTKPTWVDHVYSCTYRYADGSFLLTVKELNNLAETTAYYEALRARLGERPGPIALGNGAFMATDGSVVVRKDFKVLHVDTTHLPARFGTPPQDRSDAGLTIAATIMSCWTGA
jgi:hypothetical protein